MPDLKPCPYCDGTSLEYSKITAGNTYGFMVSCTQCGVSGPVVTPSAFWSALSGEQKHREECSAAAWNRRSEAGCKFCGATKTYEVEVMVGDTSKSMTACDGCEGAHVTPSKEPGTSTSPDRVPVTPSA